MTAKANNKDTKLKSNQIRLLNNIKNEPLDMILPNITKEIHNTAFVDKQLPTIKYLTRGMQSMTQGGEVSIEVSDRNVETAYIVFQNVLALVTAQQKSNNPKDKG